MSAYIVDNKTINIVATKISREDFWKRRVQEELGLDLNSSKDQGVLAAKMYSLNVAGVSQRYGTADDMTGEVFEYIPEYNQTMIQAYKSLQCFLYQCCEGKNIESKLYKFLNEVVVAHFADEIIRKLPEYDNAKWG